MIHKMNFDLSIQRIINSVISGIFAVFVYAIVSKFHTRAIETRLLSIGIVNRFIILSAILYTFGFVKHQFGYYSTIDSNYCKQTEICKKLIDMQNDSLVDSFKKYFSFAENVWIESVGEGVLFVFVGLPAFIFLQNKMVAAFLTGIFSEIAAEYSGMHKHFCKTSCRF